MKDNSGTDKKAYSRIIKVMQDAAEKNQHPDMELGEVQEDGRIQYRGLMLDEDDYDLIGKTLNAGDTVAVYRDQDDLIVISPSGGGEKGEKGDKGDKGEPGEAAGFGTPSVTVDNTSGTPSATVTAQGPDTAKRFAFAFYGLKGEQGPKGDTGSKGDKGDTGNTGPKGETGDTGPKGETGATGPAGAAAGFGTPTASIDSGTGIPSVEVTASGTDTAKVFAFAFHNLKGSKGDKGDKGDSAYSAGDSIEISAQNEISVDISAATIQKYRDLGMT